MTENLRKEFSKYTKEEIIAGIFDAYPFEKQLKNLLTSIKYCKELKRNEDDLKEFDRLTENSKKADEEYFKYIKELQQKYGKKIKLSQLTIKEIDKLVEVTGKYERANKEYLDNLKK